MGTMPNALGMQVPVGAGGTSTLRNVPTGQQSGMVPTSVGGMAPATAAQNNVFAPPAAVAPGGAVDGGVATQAPAGYGTIPTNNPSGVQGNNVNWVDGSNTVVGDFKDTYGAGTGTAITGVLQNMGTTNDSAIQALINQTNSAAGRQYSNIQAQEAAAGISPNSSTAGLAAGDFYSQVNEGLQTQIGQMESSQENTLLQTLLGEGAAHGGDPSLFDSILGGFNDAASIAGDVGKMATLGIGASDAYSSAGGGGAGAMAALGAL
jgi:hypothetical protein